MCIISTAQQASPKVSGQREPFRPQFTRSSTLNTYKGERPEGALQTPVHQIIHLKHILVPVPYNLLLLLVRACSVVDQNTLNFDPEPWLRTLSILNKKNLQIVEEKNVFKKFLNSEFGSKKILNKDPICIRIRIHNTACKSSLTFAL